MARSEATDGYFRWLIDSVDSEAHPVDEYIQMLTMLFNTEFYWSIEMDSNRAEDGLALRVLYFDEHPGYGQEVFDDMPNECMVLEMLIALARRCDRDIMYDPDNGDTTATWFWMMIENLGLTGFDDAVFNKQRYLAAEYVDRAVQIFLDREYEPDGTGSIFRIRETSTDMRKTELWYQLNFYLTENIDI